LLSVMVMEDENNREMVAKIYEDYYGTMLNAAKSVLRDHALAEDAVSETMLKIIRHFDKISEIPCYKLRSYIVIIVRNTALNMLKKRKNQREVTYEFLEDMPDGELSVLDSIIGDEGCELILQTIDSLSEKLSDVLHLYVYGYSHKEISELLSVSYDTVKTRLSRARQALKKVLDERNGYLSWAKAKTGGIPMRLELLVKTLFRTPLKTLITFLLIAAASFAVFSRSLDYAVTRREMARATGFYRGVAAIDNGVPNTSLRYGSMMPNRNKNDPRPLNHPPADLTIKQMTAFSSLSGVSHTDARYMTAGVIDDLSRIVNYGVYKSRYIYEDRFIVVGKYLGYETDDTQGGSVQNRLLLTDCISFTNNVLLTQDSNLRLTALAKDGKSSDMNSNMVSYYAIEENPFGQSFVDNLIVGGKYVFIGRTHPNRLEENPEIKLWLGDQDTLDYLPSFFSLTGKSDNYLETEEFAKLREIIDITNQDLKTFDIVYTSDMLAIPRFNEGAMVVQEGRALLDTDTDACVINHSLMEYGGLKIGDIITVELCDKLLPQHQGMGAVAVIPERYGKPVKTAELEIVGAYTDTDSQHIRYNEEWWSYSPNTLFVPATLLPVAVPDGYGIKPGEFSVVIDDPFMMRAFLDEAKPLAKKLGLSLRFSDGGWLKAEGNIELSQTMSLITTVAYIAAAAAALLLTAYLFIARQKKTFAIMRALGTPKAKARNSLIIPFAILTAAALPIGAAAGIIYASGTITDSLTKLTQAVTDSGYVPDTSLPLPAIIACLFGEAGFLAAFSALFMMKLSKTPPLALLVGDGGQPWRRGARKNKSVITDGGTEPAPAFDYARLSGLCLPERGKYSAVKHVAAYILKHMRRAKIKTVIAIILAIMLSAACGLLAVTRLSYQELFDGIVVIGTINNYPSSAVVEASKSVLMNDFYYSGGYVAIANGLPDGVGYRLGVTNDIERYLKGAFEAEYSIEYADGYDASFFQTNEAAILMGGRMAEYMNLKPGEIVRDPETGQPRKPDEPVKPGDVATILSLDRMSIIRGLTDNDEEFYAKIAEASQEVFVAGIVHTENVLLGNAMFAPLSEAVERASLQDAYPCPIEMAEFTLADKENPHVLNEYLDGLAKTYEIKYTGNPTYNMDTTELENVKRMRDMLTMLFPVAVAAAVCMGMAAKSLIVMNSTKEAAVLRILGTTKRRARCMIVFEQIALSLLGIIITEAGLAIYNAAGCSRGALKRCCSVLGCISRAALWRRLLRPRL